MPQVEEAKILDDKSLNDTLENLVAELGTGQDKRSHSRFINNKGLSRTEGGRRELEDMYRTDWFSGKVIDIIPDDMTREWRTFQGDILPEEIQLLEDEENRLQLRSKFNKAHKWSRLYGTGYIVIAVDDGKEPDEPLVIEDIPEGGLKHLTVFDRWQMSASESIIDLNPMSPNFGFPEYYRLNRGSIRIHYTRILRFDAVELPYDRFQENNYNSDSVLDRVYDALTNFHTTAQGSASMVYETNVDIVKVKGLMNYLQTADGQSLLQKRFTLAKTLKSFNNMMLLDSEEDYDKKTNTFSGLPELLDRFSLYLSAASDIPATRLLGSSASGFNATGEGDLKNYYDLLRSQQVSEYKPMLDYFDKIMAQHLGLPEGGDLKYEFNSLFQMTPQQMADLEAKRSETDQRYLDMGIVDELIIAKELIESGTYTNLTKDRIEELKELEGLSNGFTTDPDKDKPPIESEDEGGEQA